MDLTFQHVIPVVNALSETDKKNLLAYLEKVLCQQEDVVKLREDITEARFSHGKECPNCGSPTVVRNGKHNGVQRFLCKECRKTFGQATNTPLHSSKKKLDLWLEYAKCMVEGLSLRKSAEIVKISLPTAFYWRHKILYALAKILKIDQVEGVVETDETFFLESFKGNHSKAKDFEMTRKPRERGGTAKKRGISDEQVCVVCSVDRSGHILSDMVCKGRVKNTDLARFFTDRIKTDSILCTDEHQSYRQLAKDMGLELKQIKSGKRKEGIYHIQHVNSYHSRLKNWFIRFQGVATKYLGNYLYWFKWLTLRNHNQANDKPISLLISSSTVSIKLLWRDFKNLRPSYI